MLLFLVAAILAAADGTAAASFVPGVTLPWANCQCRGKPCMHAEMRSYSYMTYVYLALYSYSNMLCILFPFRITGCFIY